MEFRKSTLENMVITQKNSPKHKIAKNLLKNNLIKVNSSQFNHIYNHRIHFPYSVALLVGYIKSQKNLSKHFRFEKTFVFRDNLDNNVEECKDTDILLCSCYVWNWQITTLFAKQVKKINPKCTIIFGGPQVPNNLGDFFKKYPFVDIVVHGEGEVIISNIFESYIKDKDYSKVNGISTKDFTTTPQKRIENFENLPSPYLSNMVWDLVDKVEGIDWIASWETNRGCPYLCTFCDWGSATATRMRKWTEDRLFKEIEWFADNKIPYIDCCDANFGIYQDRDKRIATKLKEEKLKKGYPQTFRTNWAKFSSEKIIPTVQELQAADLFRAITLSLQSLDETTLDIIKRENLKFDTFSNLTNSFREAGIPSYTEIIMGLPGETLESFKKGLEIIMSDKTVGTLNIYNCSLLPNAPMNEPWYVEKYKIKTVSSPILLQHSSTHKRGIEEYEQIVTSTNTFTTQELKEMYILSWVVQTFHSFGILEYIERYYENMNGLPIMKFYDSFLEYCRTQESVFSRECQKLIKHVDNGYSGKGWSHYDPQLGDIIWPFEEASFLRLVLDRNKLIYEIENFINYFDHLHGFHTDHDILKDLVRFQVFLLTTRSDLEKIKSHDFNFNWKDFFVNNVELRSQPKTYFYKNLVTEQDPIQWCWLTAFIGRHEKYYKFHPDELSEKPIAELTSSV